jgi:hypothetical protein
MFTGYTREAINSIQKNPKSGIEGKRQLVVDRIEAWLAVLDGEPTKGVTRLSKIDGDCRIVWLKYSHQNVPLTAAGDLIGVIDLDQDEAAFWHWIRDRVLAGDYDAGIQQIALAVVKRMKGGL